MPRLLLVLAFLAGAPEAADWTKGATEWTADPSQAAHMADAARELAAVVPGEAEPLRLPLERWMALYRIPGLSVAVFDGRRLLWARAYGVTAAGGSDPVTLDTLFQAGSISKPVTAMAALRYVEQGRWSLDEPINDRLVSWKVPDNDLQQAEKVTLRRLLSHSAGTTVHGFPGYAVGTPVPTVVQILDGAPPANTPPVRVDLVPGSRVRYSGGGTTIVQLMMVDRLKKPFPEIMHEAVLGPLGMTRSTYEQPLPAGRAAETATGTRRDGTPVEGRWHIYPEMAAAGLWTTPADLAKVAIEVSRAWHGRSDRVLSQAMTKQMLTPQAEKFGLGFALEPEDDGFGHNGADEGFQAFLWAFKATGRGVAIMANSDNGFALFDRLAASIGRAHGWEGLEAPPDPPSVTADLLLRLHGVARAIDWYRSAKSAGGPRFGAGDLNRLGYGQLRAGDVTGALALFEANVQLYPDDANVWDSLGEGHMVAGNTKAAIEHYRKSLAMDPKNDNARRMLAKLEGVR